jgi:tRNA A37 threonylcarbamoyladenosine dehydratase
MNSSAESFNQRTLRILPAETVEKIRNCRFLFLGAGGVGGYAVELICRLGAENIVVADKDIFSISNFNRQIHALNSTIGEYKADAAVKRCREINSNISAEAVIIDINRDNAEELIRKYAPDMIIDAIDDVDAKCAVLKFAVNAKIPVISAMGAGGKVDPQMIRCADISRTSVCPLARKVRSILRKEGIKSGVISVFSLEETRTPIADADGSSTKASFGTVSFMPAAFGCHIAAAAVRFFEENQNL